MTYTRPQISAFYRDVTAGKYRGKEAESEQIERDIFAATNEGRIVWPKWAAYNLY